jgi:hypothetical protein
MLLAHVQAELAQAVGEGIFIDLFEMAVAVIDMDGVGGLTQDVAKLVDGPHRS